jgi:hypothetical protein
MQIKVMSDDADFVTALETPPEAGATPAAVLSEFAIGTAKNIRGAAEGWWELVCALGIVSFPIGVIGNLLASWIWSAITRTPKIAQDARVIKLVLRDGSRVAELQIESKDRESLRTAIEAALVHVHSE